MAASINAVAPTCVSAPAATQGQKLAGGCVPLERRLELVRRDELVPSVRTARQPAQNVFGADDRQGEALERAVERGGDHEASRLDHLRTAPDEEAKIPDMLDHFHR